MRKLLSISLAAILALSVGLIGCGDEAAPEITEYTLTISSSEGGEITSPGEGTFNYQQGTNVTLLAFAHTGYRFVNWTGDVGTTEDVNAPTTTVTVNGNYTVTAKFVAQYVLKIDSVDGGKVTIPGEGTFTRDAGMMGKLAAMPDRGYRFLNWAGDVGTIADVNGASTTITMNGDYTIAAHFKEDKAVTLPDPSLEAAVRQAISVPEGRIYALDIERLIALHAEQSHISDLTGLEYATHLIRLELLGNQISDISPLRNLFILNYVFLGDNQISDISPLAGRANLSDMRSLDLRDNQIRDISPLANLTTLISLNLGDNQISDISPLAGHANLVWLGLWGNQITDISPLTNLKGLASLSLGNNQISDISPLANLTGLPELSLWNNQISDISPLGNLTNLTTLQLDSNRISDISPLVQNGGLGTGDMVYLRRNPLNSDSINIYIPQLQARGVTVLY